MMGLDRTKKILIAVVVIEGLGLLMLCVMVLALSSAVAMTFQPGGLTEEIVTRGDPSMKIALVPIKGPIGSGAPFAFGGVGWEGVRKQLRRASEDERVIGILLDVETPGGEITASDIIRREVTLARGKGKRVVAILGNVAASGGYYIACGCEKIVAHPTTLTGSIGVIWSAVNIQGLMEKIGVKDVTIKSVPRKDLGSPFREMTPEERRIIEKITGAMHDRFVGLVAEGRRMPQDEVRKLADGSIFTGEEALRLGLVDETGYLDDAVALVEKLAGVEGATVVRYEERRSLFEFLSMRRRAGSVARVARPMYLWRPSIEMPRP